MLFIFRSSWSLFNLEISPKVLKLNRNWYRASTIWKRAFIPIWMIQYPDTNWSVFRFSLKVQTHKAAKSIIVATREKLLRVKLFRTLNIQLPGH